MSKSITVIVRPGYSRLEIPTEWLIARVKAIDPSGVDRSAWQKAIEQWEEMQETEAQ